MGFENLGRPWLFVISTERSEWRNPSYGCLDYARHDSAWFYGNKGFIISVSWSFSRRKPSWPNFEVIS